MKISSSMKLKNPLKHIKSDKLLIPLMAVSPFAGIGAMIYKKNKDDPEGLKRSLYDARNFIKQDVTDISKFAKSNLKSITNGVGSIFNKLLVPLTIGGIIFAVIILKK